MNDPREEVMSFFAKIEQNFLGARFTDVHVTCGDGKVFLSHRLILTAASDYFNTILDQSFDKSSHVIDVNLPPSISSDIFRLLLRYMYSGRVSFLCDENVCQLLIASYFLRMESIQKACLHYLSQKGVPKDWAVPLFRYACSQNDPSLQSTASRFLLKNKQDISARNVTPFEFKILLSHFRATSRVEEESMLEKILEWTLPLLPDNQSREQVKSNFLSSANAYSFEYLPQNYKLEYFKKMIANDHPLRLREGASWTSFSSKDCQKNSALHMFSYCTEGPLKLSTLSRKGGAWSSRSLYSPAGMGTVQRLRCAVIGDRLYWLASRNLDRLVHHNYLTFHFSPTIDISADSYQLPSPFLAVHPPLSSLHVCSDARSTIFACIGNANILSSYNCEQIQWFDVHLGNDFFPRAMTWYDRRLYLFGGVSPTSSVNALRTLDPREGLFREVLRYEHFYGSHFEFCSHKERLYLATARDFPSKMIIFDPVATKLMNMLVRPHPIVDLECRLASFQDTLYTFFSDANSLIQVDCFDTYTQTFENVPVDRTMGPGSHLMDAVVYKP